MYTEAPPRWLKSAATLALISTAAGIFAVLVVILIGFTNPKPIGEPVIDDSLTSGEGWTSSLHTEWEVLEQGFRVSVPQAAARIYLTSPYTLNYSGTIELTARQSGDPQAMSGIWWGSEQTRTVVEIGGDGYFGILSINGTSSRMITNLRRFPWIPGQGKSNRIRVDLLADGQAQVRLNDEVAENFLWDADFPTHVGLFVETTSGSDEAEVFFERLRLWQAQP